MELIGTHNSATGERPLGFLSKLLNFTAKCQSKTIWEQLEAGVRLFDLRVTDKMSDGTRADMYNIYLHSQCGHGKCLYNITLVDAVLAINDYCMNYRTTAYAIVTFEGSLTDDEREDFRKEITRLFFSIRWFWLLQVAVKKPKWELLLDNTKAFDVYYVTDYFMYDKWYRYLLPFPRLWKRWQKYTDTGRKTFSLRDFV